MPAFVNFYHILFLLLIYFNWNYFVMRSNTIRRAWVDLLSKSKRVKILLAVCAYTMAKFICKILCSAYITLLQKVTRYAQGRLSPQRPWCVPPRWLDGSPIFDYNAVHLKCCDVLLAGSFWLAALRLMDQSREILLGHSVFLYCATSEYSMTQLSSYCTID